METSRSHSHRCINPSPAFLIVVQVYWFLWFFLDNSATQVNADYTHTLLIFSSSWHDGLLVTNSPIKSSMPRRILQPHPLLSQPRSQSRLFLYFSNLIHLSTRIVYRDVTERIWSARSLQFLKGCFSGHASTDISRRFCVL